MPKLIDISRPFEGLLDITLDEAVARFEYLQDPFDKVVRDSWPTPPVRLFPVETDCEYCGGSGLTTEGLCACQPQLP